MAKVIDRLIHEVTLQRLRNDNVVDGTGGNIDTWDVIGTYPANVRYLDGRELVNAQQIVAQATHRIRMMNVGPISPQDRVIFEGRMFGIGSVARENERNIYYSIIAYERIGENL